MLDGRGAHLDLGNGLPIVPGRMASGGLAATTGEHSVMP